MTLSCIDYNRKHLFSTHFHVAEGRIPSKSNRPSHHGSTFAKARPLPVHWRLRCADHHQPGRSCPIQRLWTGDYSRAHAAKSPTTQAQFLRPLRVKHSRTGHRQRQVAAKLTTFVTVIRSFMKPHAIPWQKLYARFSEHTFDQGNRLLVSRVATDLDIRDRVSMKTCRLSQVPNRPIQRSTRHPDLCTCHRHEAVPLSHVTRSQLMITMSPNQRGIQ